MMEAKFFDSASVEENSIRARAYALSVGVSELAVSPGGTYAVADEESIDRYCAETGQASDFWLIETID